MVNNFDIIEKMLTFDDKEDFYFLQILQRKKENPQIGSNSRVIRTYYITSTDHLKYEMQGIQELCKVFNSRAYINLNKRNFKKTFFKLQKLILEQAENGSYSSFPYAFDTICGKYHSSEDKSWIVDLDYDDSMNFTEMVYEVEKFIETLQPKSEYAKIIAEIPTKNGLHLITSPFNLQEFKKKFPQIDVHKNNPTLLYTI